MHSDKPRGDGHKLKGRKFSLNIRKCYFIGKVTEFWDKLPTEAVNLEILKSHLDMVLSSQV